MEVKKVLVVDDSLLGRISLKKSISNFNFEITEAENGYDALIKIESTEFDLVFLDLLMPKVDGFQVLEELQKRNNKTPVVIQSKCHGMFCAFLST